MSYQMNYDPVAYAAYQDATGSVYDGVDVNGMTVGGAPASPSISFNTNASYGVGVTGTGTALCVVGLCAAAYLLLFFDRNRT